MRTALHSVDFDGEPDDAVSGAEIAVTADRERELRRGVAEAGAGDDGHAVQLALALDDGRQGVGVHFGSPLELAYYYPTHALEARLVNDRLQRPVEVNGVGLFVVLEQEDASL